MLDTIRALTKEDRDYPQRTWDLDWRRRVLNGRHYDLLAYEFHQERQAGGEYIPIAQRRPSARFALVRTVVRDSIALLFGEGRFPAIDCPEPDIRELLIDLVAETKLPRVMTDAAFRGSIGSVAVLMRVLKGRLFFNAIDSVFLTPEYDPDAPDTLVRVTETYRVKGKELLAAGYDGIEENETYWFRREWDSTDEAWFLPQKEADKRDGKAPVRDAARSVTHNLGFVPMVWVRNLPGPDEIDGAPTFPEELVRTSIEIDYLLSQNGRGLKYSLDPTLLIKEPAAPSGEIIKGAGNALVVDASGDAKLLEISGTASNAVLEWVRGLRELALEGAHGNRSNPDVLSGARSGVAMKLMHQALIWLADDLRASYGEDALLSLVRMVARASQQLEIKLLDGAPVKLDPAMRYALRWPDWFSPTNDDLAQEATSLVALVAGGLMSRETAIKRLAANYDISDVEAEQALIDGDAVKADARAAKQAKDLAAADPVATAA
jgi:hypothetical protein